MFGLDRKWLEEGQTSGKMAPASTGKPRYRLQSLEIPGMYRMEENTQSVGDIRMAFSLYDATVANYLQILGAVSGFLEKSLTHFREKGIDPSEVVEDRKSVV